MIGGRDAKPANPIRPMTAREVNRAAGVTVYEFTFEPRRGEVRGKSRGPRAIMNGGDHGQRRPVR